MLLNFKDDNCVCPCPDSIQEQLLDFHLDLMKHCGNFKLEKQKQNRCMVCTFYLFLFFVLLGVELEEDRGTDCDSDFTIRGRLMSLVEKVASVKIKIENQSKQKKDRKASELKFCSISMLAGWLSVCPYKQLWKWSNTSTW